jgi:hypothetical protein
MAGLTWDDAGAEFGPLAYLSHEYGCTCPDCRAAREEAGEYHEKTEG